MTTSTTRVATPGDADALARMLHDFNTEFAAPVEAVPVLADRWARRLLDPDVLAVVATGGGPGGSAYAFGLATLRPTMFFDGPLAVLDELYVAPAHRGQGTGSLLLARIREELALRGCPEMHVNVDEVDVDARRFYERHGLVNVEDPDDGRMLCYVGPVLGGSEPDAAVT